DPQSAEAHAQRGHELRLLVNELPPAARKRILTLALDQLKKADDLGMRSAALFDDAGAVLENLGQGREARTAYSRGLDLAPKDVKLLVKRGWINGALQDYPN